MNTALTLHLVLPIPGGTITVDTEDPAALADRLVADVLAIGHHGRQVRVTHRMTAEESWVPCDRIGLGFVRAFDADRPAA